MNLPKVLLASESPRRKFLLEEAGVEFRQMSPKVVETLPEDMEVDKIPEHLAQLKAQSLLDERRDGEVILAADSIVVISGELLGKPKDKEDAKETLKRLSGRSHQVITGLCMITQKGSWHQSEVSEVIMADLSDEEVDYYVERCVPLDKAGSYGIQEWLGLCRVSRIEGTYSNIMGLPMYTVYEMLKKVE
ncbi:MAG: septum formation protein Maf [Saprospirales bacterium]|nr:MAG: septum formation protein Maf [Saprospirales bacterium]